MIRRQDGMVLVPVLLVVILMIALTMVTMSSAHGVLQRLSFKDEGERLSAIGDAALDLTMAEIWSDHLRQHGGTPGSIADFRLFLDQSEIPADLPYPKDIRDTIKLASNARTEELETLQTALATAIEIGSSQNVIDKLQRSVDRLTDWNQTVGRLGFAGAYVHRLTVWREDGTGSTLLRVAATVCFGPPDSGRRTLEVERGYYVAGEEFNGFDYGLLANNVNCIMCHANIDNAERYYNRDPDRYGTFGRVRIGTLESMRIRADKTDSHVAGTIYTRGAFVAKDGTPIEDPSDTDLTSVEFTEDGLIKEDADGNPIVVELELAEGDPLPANKSLYLDYSTDTGRQVDGEMPTSFPPVIPDHNGNRRVDDDELAEAAAAATGTLTSGLKTLVPPGRAYAAARLPGVDSAGDLEGLIEGSLILKGTPESPLTLAGRVVVDGDVVIVGTVKGAGEIIARGNVYIVGPVLYADGTDALGNRTFGKDAEGHENRLTLGAGGNIMVGDFLMTKNTMNGDIEADSKQDKGDPDELTPEEAIEIYLEQVAKVETALAALNAAIVKGRSKDIKSAQWVYDRQLVKLDTATKALPPDYFGEPEPEGEEDPWTIPAPAADDPRVADPRGISGDMHGMDNFTASEITLFNRIEWTKTQPTMPNDKGQLVANPLYVENYIPRYYTLYADNPVYAFIGGDAWFDPTTGSWLGKEHVSGFDSDGVVEFLPGTEQYLAARITPFMPIGRWLSDTQLINFWTEVTQSIPQGTPFGVDALLYSNNATMFLSRKATTYGGRAVINGALVGADLGVLVPGNGGVGLQLNYDMRHKGVLRLRSSDRAKLVRGPRFR